MTFLTRMVLASACAVLAGPLAPADVRGGLKKMFVAGEKNTPTALNAARKEYQQLKQQRPQDARIDYAYGVVLLNQRRYGDALPLIVPYAESDQAHLGAVQARLWAELQSKRWTEALATAEHLAQQCAQQPAEAREQATPAARFLGAVLGYLERTRAGAVDPAQFARCQEQVESLLEKNFAAAWQEGQAIAKERFAALEQEAKAASAKTAAAAGDRAAQEQANLAEVREDRSAQDEAMQASVEQQRGNRTQLADLQRQLTNVRARQTDLTRDIARAESDLSDMRRRFRKDKDLTFNERQKLDNVNQRLLDLNVRLQRATKEAGALEVQMANLGAKDQRDAAAFADTKAAAQKKDRKAKATENRLRKSNAKAVPKPPPLAGKITMLSHYAPLAYAEERTRVLGWFGK